MLFSVYLYILLLERYFVNGTEKICMYVSVGYLITGKKKSLLSAELCSNQPAFTDKGVQLAEISSRDCSKTVIFTAHFMKDSNLNAHVVLAVTFSITND